jgi:hypothetical protein
VRLRPGLGSKQFSGPIWRVVALNTDRLVLLLRDVPRRIGEASCIGDALMEHRSVKRRLRRIVVIVAFYKKAA